MGRSYKFRLYLAQFQARELIRKKAATRDAACVLCAQKHSVDVAEVRGLVSAAEIGCAQAAVMVQEGI